MPRKSLPRERHAMGAAATVPTKAIANRPDFRGILPTHVFSN